MKKFMAFFRWVLGMIKSFFLMVMGLFKKTLCWLHEKFCGC